MDFITLALARKYTKDMVNGLGSLKGAPCVIESIEEHDDQSVITFSWTGNDGVVERQKLAIPHGASSEEIQALSQQISEMNESVTNLEDKANESQDSIEQTAVDLKQYVDEQIKLVEPDRIDDGEI